MRQGGGAILCRSEPGRGTEFSIYLPRAAGRAEPAARPAAETPTLRGAETILLVEDEARIRDLARRFLSEYGYSVIPASCGREALEISSKLHGAVDLLLTDVVMPDLDGGELADRLRGIYPGLRVLFMTGYADRSLTGKIARQGSTAVIRKPFDPPQLAQQVREVLDRGLKSPRAARFGQ